VGNEWCLGTDQGGTSVPQEFSLCLETVKSCSNTLKKKKKNRFLSF
jgi:hypothetical protein